jgi:mannan endo-1,4-beta-mannosidase
MLSSTQTMKKIAFVLPILLLVACSPMAQTFKPVNKNASKEATDLLACLYEINGKHILSGQHNYNSDLNVFSDSAKAITGKYPALWGTDFILWGDKDLGQNIVNESIKNRARVIWLH